MKRVIEAEYYKDYKIIITFNNGVKKMYNPFGLNPIFEILNIKITKLQNYMIRLQSRKRDGNYNSAR